MDRNLIEELLTLIKSSIICFPSNRDLDMFNSCKESFLITLEAVNSLEDENIRIGYLQELEQLAIEINEIDEAINSVPRPATVLLKKYYDYCFLRYMHERVSKVDVETIVVGSSHALNGIDEKLFQNGCINLSMHSQDIYYDYINAKKAIKESKEKIKNCVIVMGYYIIAQDVSLESRYGHEMIKHVYYPVLNDAHNWTDPETIDIWNDQDIKFSKSVHCVSDSDIWNEVCNWFDENSTYYNSMRGRGNGIFDFSGRKWPELSNEERDEFGQKRAADHNKILRYDKTIEENFSLLNEFVEFLNENLINPYIVITPFTKEYNKYISPKYKELILEAINNLPNNVVYLDMNDLDLFDSYDFVDTDHLNEKGAEKVSKYIVASLLDK